MTAPPPRPSRAYVLGFRVLLLVVAAFVFSIFLRHPGIDGYGRALYAEMIHGQAFKPYVMRALVPLVVRGLHGAIPDGARAAAQERLAADEFVQELCRRFRWERSGIVLYLVGCAVMFAALLAFARAMGFLFESLYMTEGRRPRDAVMLAALLLLPPCFVNYGHVYDFAQLFLFTLALALLARRRLFLYLAVFALGCVNKETTVLAALVFALHFRDPARFPPRRFRALLAVQAGIFVVVRGALAWTFRANPGAAVEFHLVSNLLDLPTYGLADAAAWALTLLAVFHRFGEKPRLLRDALWVAVPLVLSTLVFANLNELRDYYEAYPAVLLLGFHSAARMVGVPLTPRESAASVNLPPSPRA